MTLRRRHAAHLTALLVVCAVARSAAWTVTLKGPLLGANLYDEANAVVALPGGDVVACGQVNASVNGMFVVARLALADGTVVWRTEIGGPGVSAYAACSGLKVGPAGEIYAAGFTSDASCMPVHRLDPTTGAVVWSGGPACGSFSSIAIDTAGDVIVGGRIGDDFDVAKLDGATGAGIWTFLLAEDDYDLNPDLAMDVAADAAGDVYAAGAVLGTDAWLNDEVDLACLKLAGDTGAELWRYTFDGDRYPLSRDTAHHVALDGTGGVFLSGYADMEVGRAFVAKLDAADGTESWSYVADDVFPAGALAVDAGDVIVAGDGVEKRSGVDGSGIWSALKGTLRWIGTAAEFDPSTGELVLAGESVVRVSPSTGVPSWQGDPLSGSLDLAVSDDGQMTVVNDALARPSEGVYDEPPSLFTVMSFADRITGRALRFIDPAGVPTSRRLIVKTTDVRILGSAPGGPADPSINGATLTVRNPTTAETASFVLPASLWKATGNSRPANTGFAYRDKLGAAGPCKKVVVRDGKGIKATCKGSGLPAFLDEPSQGDIAISLTTGLRQGQCLLFGGDVQTDEPGAFVATNALQPAVCP